MTNTVDDYIASQTSPQREICLALRELIRKTIPGASEAMKWGVPAFGDGKFYIVALKDHVNLGFATAGLTREETGLFDGGGKTTKHIQVASPDSIDEKRIVNLLKLVDSK